MLTESSLSGLPVLRCHGEEMGVGGNLTFTRDTGLCQAQEKEDHQGPLQKWLQSAHSGAWTQYLVFCFQVQEDSGHPLFSQSLKTKFAPTHALQLPGGSQLVRPMPTPPAAGPATTPSHQHLIFLKQHSAIIICCAHLLVFLWPKCNILFGDIHS